MLSGLEPHHICYAADDLEEAATAMARGLGAGPFFVMPHAPFDELLPAGGGPCTWDHEHAFGRLGSQVVELTKTIVAEPPELASAFGARPINHLGYTAPDLEAASAELVAAGATRFLSARRGPVRMAYHLVPGLGCIELLQAHEVHNRLTAALASQAADWDGSRPLRAESPL